MDKGYYIVGCMWLACNPNGKSQSTIKMDKGYYTTVNNESRYTTNIVAIHNKNGQGLLLIRNNFLSLNITLSQSTIKMDKGYYSNTNVCVECVYYTSQSTIKMDKGYYK